VARAAFRPAVGEGGQDGGRHASAIEPALKSYVACMRYMVTGMMSTANISVKLIQGQMESTLTALQGWTALFNSLQSDIRVAMTPSFSTDIRDAQ